MWTIAQQQLRSCCNGTPWGNHEIIIINRYFFCFDIHCIFDKVGILWFMQFTVPFLPCSIHTIDLNRSIPRRIPEDLKINNNRHNRQPEMNVTFPIQCMWKKEITILTQNFIVLYFSGTHSYLWRMLVSDLTRMPVWRPCLNCLTSWSEKI